MKRIQVLLLSLGMIAAFAASVYAAKSDVSGVVSKIIGSVQIKRAGSAAFIGAKVGDFVYSGDSVKTLPRSRALISFTNGVEARLHANTNFTVSGKDQARKSDTTSIKMGVGKLWTKVLRQKTKFDIHTPVATISVRGTEYETSVGDKGDTTLKVFDGEVECGNEYGTARVRKGQMNNTGAGGPPGEPKDMGEGDKDNWQDEVKSAGSIKIELAKSEAKLNESVDGKLTVNDSNSKKNTAYAKELKLTCDNSSVVFAAAGGDQWSSSLNLKPSQGEASFKVKASAGGTMNISATGDELGASMAVLDVKLPPKKDLRIKMKGEDGSEKEFILKFKAK